MMRWFLVVMFLAGCGGPSETCSGDCDPVGDGNEVADDSGSAADSVSTLVERVLPRRAFDAAAAARGQAFFEGDWTASGLIPTLALRHLYLAWPGQIFSKFKYFQSEDDYWPAFRARYGFHEAPFDNDGLPLGLRASAQGNVALDCLSCHAGPVGDTVVVGAPNTHLRLQLLYDDLFALPAAVEALREMDLPEPYKSLLDNAPLPEVAPVFSEMTNRTGAPGVTDAMGLGLALSTRIRPNDAIHTELGFQDPPAWWTLAYKPRAYRDGSAEVGASRLMMATMLAYTADVPALDAQFEDIHEYLLSLDPPEWPGAVDVTLAAAGAVLFQTHCAECHGMTEFPDRVVVAAEVGTDPLRAERFGAAEAEQVNALVVNDTHRMTPTGGYLAPTLVGIHASGPYLHNGSVPDMRTLLDPDSRPAVWRAIEPEVSLTVGLAWESATPGDDAVYETSRPGLSNAGHRYGETLSEAERTALIEFIKTL